MRWERDGSAKEGESGVQTVRDVVGGSPTYEVEGGGIAGNREDEDENNGGVYDEEDGQELEVHEGIEVDEVEELYGGDLENETPDIQLRLGEHRHAEEQGISVR